MKLSLYALFLQFFIAFSLQAELEFEPNDLSFHETKWHTKKHSRYSQAYNSYSYNGYTVFHVRKSQAAYFERMRILAKQQKAVLVLKDTDIVFFQSAESIQENFILRPSPRYLRIEPFKVYTKSHKSHSWNERKYYVSFDGEKDVFMVNKEIYNAIKSYKSAAISTGQLMVIELPGLSSPNAKMDNRFSLEAKKELAIVLEKDS